MFHEERKSTLLALNINFLLQFKGTTFLYLFQMVKSFWVLILIAYNFYVINSMAKDRYIFILKKN